MFPLILKGTCRWTHKKTTEITHFVGFFTNRKKVKEAINCSSPNNQSILGLTDILDLAQGRKNSKCFPFTFILEMFVKMWQHQGENECTGCRFEKTGENCEDLKILK